MNLRQILQGLIFFVVSFTSGTCLCAVYFALAPLNEAAAIKSWVNKHPGSWWVEGEDRFLIGMDHWDPQNTPGGPRTVVIEAAAKSSLYFLQGSGSLPADSRELIRGGRTRVIESPRPLVLRSDHHQRLRPLMPNVQLVQKLPWSSSPLKKINSLGAAIDAETWRSEVDELSRFSRYTYGSEIEAARMLISSRFRALGLEVEELSFATPRGMATNIIAKLPGRSRSDEIYVIGAHYDSTSEKPFELAPGAEDNASGAAGLLSLARVFVDQPPEATLLFIAFSGEEQGLLGSRAFLNPWLADGRAAQIHGGFIMDMIGYSGDAELDCLLETSAATRTLLNQIQAAHADPELVLSESLDYWGSDHVPFLDNKIPTVLFIENDYLDYPAYHRSADSADKIHPQLGPKILGLIAQTIGSLAY
ncbi:MAG TPA: M28 family peptidase [Oligoflexus sp.]|uniref:M28 family metallopeptidase n=1 Tax=Oligoflexus sp. TaxID=1971216 RepID=UPI002D80FFF9|nr:M28 family peptidase [Oligoflexus sp.]HET9237044.1 M28 family peptidase [Oligoflexus sp.]